MTATIARKVAVRTEYTGSVSADRAQQQAQLVSRAHEVTKLTVQALANSAYVALTTDYTQAATATYATIISTTITTVLPSGYLVITFSVSGQQITNASTDVFRATVDGVAAGGCYQSTIVSGVFSASVVTRVAVTRGPHTIALQSKVNNNSLTIHALTVPGEEHAHLFVQEMP